jgi:phospholipid/cholesterol/gamma-HCH transport system substrate-binding protein
METKANYVITGSFTLAVVVAAFAFIFWFEHHTSGGGRTDYRIVFNGSVAGLQSGAAVNFNGIRVGAVADLALDKQDPRKVLVTIAIDRDVPVRADTKVGLEFQGLTGLATVALTGGAADAAMLVADDGAPPVLHADPELSADVTKQARDVLTRIDGLVGDNELALRSSLRNIETVTATLAENSQRLDKVMTGLQSLIGGSDGNNSGQVGQAADAIRKLAEDLDKNTNQISAGLAQFSNSGLKEFEAFAVDGRKTLGELNKAIKNIDQHPTRLIFGH